jgi:Rps23 Pro-64 3,4-dihydroxylase Tpa1-like proline 4-hydroxylase
MGYLNPDLDLPAIRSQLQARSRVQVPNFFSPNVADALHRALQEVDWGLAYRGSGGDEFVSGATLRELDPAGRGALSDQISGHAANGHFQFSFFSHSIVAAAQSGQTDLLSRFALWMAQEEFLSVMRTLSGEAGLNRVYAQATCYSAGNFLLLHDDQVPTEDRKLAYVINLSRGWRPDWGGLLQFCDERNQVIDTFVPHFNSLSLFTVPQDHFVSFVAPYAQADRLAVTGWLIVA